MNFTHQQFVYPKTNSIQNVTFIFSMSKAVYSMLKRLRWSRGSVLAFGTQVRGFKPGRSRRIFQGEEILSTPSFGREVKPFFPCRIFAACKRTRKCMRGSRSFRSKLPAISLLSLLGSLVEKPGGASRKD